MKPELNEQELSVLRTNPLFRGLDRERLERQLQVMKAEKTRSARGEMLQRLGEPIRCFGIVLSGSVQVCVDDIEGSRMIMAEVDPGDAFLAELQGRFTAALAAKALTMNNRIQVLSRLSLRGKLTAYFTELAAAQGSNEIRLPMNREDTAAYIGANRSALSRELAKMKEEGLIDYHKNQIRILTVR